MYRVSASVFFGTTLLAIWQIHKHFPEIEWLGLVIVGAPVSIIATVSTVVFLRSNQPFLKLIHGNKVLNCLRE